MPSVPFDAIAAGYDRAMARVSEPFVPDLLAACALDAGDFLLDVGTGTGLVAAAASAMGAAARVVGLDVSPAMLARARDRPRRTVWPSSRTMSRPSIELGADYYDHRHTERATRGAVQALDAKATE